MQEPEVWPVHENRRLPDRTRVRTGGSSIWRGGSNPDSPLEWLRNPGDFHCSRPERMPDKHLELEAFRTEGKLSAAAAVIPPMRKNCRLGSGLVVEIGVVADS